MSARNADRKIRIKAVPKITPPNKNEKLVHKSGTPPKKKPPPPSKKEKEKEKNIHVNPVNPVNSTACPKNPTADKKSIFDAQTEDKVPLVGDFVMIW